MRHAPSRIEYSEWTWRWTNDASGTGRCSLEPPPACNRPDGRCGPLPAPPPSRSIGFPDRRRLRMYARLISFSDADPARREEAVQTMRETVIPMLRRYDGYAGYIALYDAGNRRANAIVLW